MRMIDYSKLKKNPDNERWVMGWLVYNEERKVFESIHISKDEAIARAETLGKPFAVSYGSHTPGTDEYILEDNPE